jgi:DnaJ family protein C protein 28
VKEQQSPRDWESWIDQQIREAQERGAFDDLPGKGQPLDLVSNPYAQEQEMAYKILKDAGYAPEWIELDKSIRGRLEQAQATLTRSWEWRQVRLGELANRMDRWSVAEQQRVLAGWQGAVTAFEEEIAAINQEIAALNLKVPAPCFQRNKVDAAREVARLEAELPVALKGPDAEPETRDPEYTATNPQERMADTVRQIVTRRERAPRSPRMERALKRLIWRYTRGNKTEEET